MAKPAEPVVALGRDRPARKSPLPPPSMNSVILVPHGLVDLLGYGVLVAIRERFVLVDISDHVVAVPLN
jgi:hypothetical protein